MEVVEGEYFIASVEAEGSNLTYQWEFLAVGSTKWKASTATAYKVATLKLRATPTISGRSFRCVISDDQGNWETSEEITLTVTEAPVEPIVITKQPESKEVIEGEDFIASVEADGSNLTYQWEFLAVGSTKWKASTATAYKKATLILKATLAINGRSYRCVISDDQGNTRISDEVILTVTEAPPQEPIVITKQPESKEVIEGENFIASVEAEGNNLTYQWEFLAVGSTTWKASTATAYKEATLILKTTLAINGRSYRCVISDDQGNTRISDEVTLTVTETPVEPIVITKQPESKEVIEGEDFIASVEAEGSNLTYQWEFLAVGSTTWKASTATAYKEATLILKATPTINGRSYRCVISDDQGNTKTSNEVTLTVLSEFTDERFKYRLTDNRNGIIITKYLLDEESVYVPNTLMNLPVTEIGEEAFMSKGMISISLPNTITVFHVRAFKNCTNLSTMSNHD